MKREYPEIPMHVEESINMLAETAYWGLMWGWGTEDASYECGCVETVAHILACAMCQWFGADYYPTPDMRDELRLTEYHTKKQLKKRLVKIVKRLNKKGKESI